MSGSESLAGAGRRLIVWITPDRQLEPGINRFDVGFPRPATRGSNACGGEDGFDHQDRARRCRRRAPAADRPPPRRGLARPAGRSAPPPRGERGPAPSRRTRGRSRCGMVIPRVLFARSVSTPSRVRQQYVGVLGRVVDHLREDVRRNGCCGSAGGRVPMRARVWPATAKRYGRSPPSRSVTRPGQNAPTLIHTQ